MYNLSKLLVSLFGIGFFPIASGTVGSFFSIVLFSFLINYFSSLIIFFIFISTFIISIFLIDIYSNFSKNHDSSEIVIDEFIGISFIYIFYPYLKFSNNILTFVLIFIIFRFFDIVKVFPANWIDKNIKNSWGVILDDVVAGFYSIVSIYIFHAII